MKNYRGPSAQQPVSVKRMSLYADLLRDGFENRMMWTSKTAKTITAVMIVVLREGDTEPNIKQ